VNLPGQWGHRRQSNEAGVAATNMQGDPSVAVHSCVAAASYHAGQPLREPSKIVETWSEGQGHSRQLCVAVMPAVCCSETRPLAHAASLNRFQRADLSNRVLKLSWQFIPCQTWRRRSGRRGSCERCNCGVSAERSPAPTSAHLPDAGRGAADVGGSVAPCCCRCCRRQQASQQASGHIRC
jgi:hypothetical protein